VSGVGERGRSETKLTAAGTVSTYTCSTASISAPASAYSTGSHGRHPTVGLRVVFFKALRLRLRTGNCHRHSPRSDSLGIPLFFIPLDDLSPFGANLFSLLHSPLEVHSPGPCRLRIQTTRNAIPLFLPRRLAFALLRVMYAHNRCYQLQHWPQIKNCCS
jgi:hypothetical protein